jgi:hypothetical protein
MKLPFSLLAALVVAVPADHFSSQPTADTPSGPIHD